MVGLSITLVFFFVLPNLPDGRMIEPNTQSDHRRRMLHKSEMAERNSCCNDNRCVSGWEFRHRSDATLDVTVVINA